MEVFDIKDRIHTKLVEKIFGNAKNGIHFLRQISGDIPNNLKAQEIYNLIVQKWDYEIALPAVRKIFKETEKFQRGLQAENTIKILLNEWKELEFGEIKWPFSQGAFDSFVQGINSEKSSRANKDEKVKDAAIRYRRIKEINTERNDFLESLIFEKNKNIIPTLSHNKGVDFFIDGISFDQKVSRSVTDKFKKDFQENWKIKAIENPELVAKYLYEQQDEGRFGSGPRLYIVYLDEDISPIVIKKSIEKIDLDKPMDIVFILSSDKGFNKELICQSLIFQSLNYKLFTMIPICVHFLNPIKTQRYIFFILNSETSFVIFR